MGSPFSGFSESWSKSTLGFKAKDLDAIGNFTLKWESHHRRVLAERKDPKMSQRMSCVLINWHEAPSELCFVEWLSVQEAQLGGIPTLVLRMCMGGGNRLPSDNPSATYISHKRSLWMSKTVLRRPNAKRTSCKL